MHSRCLIKKKTSLLFSTIQLMTLTTPEKENALLLARDALEVGGPLYKLVLHGWSELSSSWEVV